METKGFKSMAVWVLEGNPSLGFYKRLGAARITSKEIEIGGASLQEIAMAWTEFKDLAEPLRRL